MLPRIIPEGKHPMQVRRSFGRLNEGVIDPLSRNVYRAFLLDKDGSALSTGLKNTLLVPRRSRIVSCYLFATPSGSITVDILRSSYAGYPSTTSICGGLKPSISSGRKAHLSESDIHLKWAMHLERGEILDVSVESATTVQRALVCLDVELE